MTKLLMILLLMLFLDFTTHAQLVLSGGVVNRYAAVTAINAGSRTVTIGTESGAAHTWAIGDRVLLVQMTGNTAANGGKFEFATIESIAGTTLTISQLTRTYSPSTDKVQLVWIPYDATSITVSANISAQKWDGTTGGIVGLLTPGTITLNGNVSADGAGFRFADGTNTITGSDIYYGGAGGANYQNTAGGGGGGYGASGKYPILQYGPHPTPSSNGTSGNLNGGSAAVEGTTISSGGGGGAGVGAAGGGGSARANGAVYGEGGGAGGGGAGYSGGGAGGRVGAGIGGAGSIGAVGDANGVSDYFGGGGGGANRYKGGGGGNSGHSYDAEGKSGTNGGTGGISSGGSEEDYWLGGAGGGTTPAAHHTYQFYDFVNAPTADNRIWMAGGSNNTTQGGGIVLVSAASIVANAKTISANGDAGVAINSTFTNSGGGGGGGGGLVVVNVAGVSAGPLALQAKGGDGKKGTTVGSVSSGGGGGGGGGVIWVKDPTGTKANNSTGILPTVANLSFSVDGGTLDPTATNAGGGGGKGAVMVNDPCGVFGNCITCNAGITAPVLSTTTKSNICPVGTANLSTITASNMPVGTVITWHSATPATTANKLSNTTGVAAGTYYAAFFDATNNCYSGLLGAGTATTAITVSIVDCCSAGHNAPILNN